MCLIEKYFAFASISIDNKERIEQERDAIFAMGMIVEPRRTLSLLKQIELEESLTEEEKQEIKNVKMKLNDEGTVESDPEIQKLIRAHSEKGDAMYRGGRQKVSVETLKDMLEKDKNAG